MTQFIDHIFYINLDYRIDRRNEIESELVEYGLEFERFSAIPHKIGIAGCSMSHLEILKMAKSRGYKNVLIFEDDFFFIVKKEVFIAELTRVFESNVEFNVLFLSYNSKKDEPVEKYPFLSRAINVQTASGYIVNSNYYDKLISLYEWSIPKLIETGQHWIYGNDIVWFSFQEEDLWYFFKNRIGKQRNGFSDNAQSYISYDC
jgi:glycosyl transferase family 25